MYIESVPNRNSPPAVLLREGWREDGKVGKRPLANLIGGHKMAKHFEWDVDVNSQMYLSPYSAVCGLS